MYGIARDVTERKRAEEALKKSEEEFRQLLEYIPVSVALVDNDENITYMNKQLIDTLGYTLEDVPDMSSWWLLAYPDKKYREEVMARWGKAVQKAVATRQHIEPEEYNVTCKDGTVLIMEIFGTTIGNNNMVIFNDITVRKNYEMEKILYSEEVFSKAFVGSPHAKAISDIKTSRILDTNKMFTQITGYKKQEAVGSTPMELGILTQGDRDNLRDVLKRDGFVKNHVVPITTKEWREALFQLLRRDTHHI